MPNHLSILGIIHTAISILAILAGLFALLRDGKIDPANHRGSLYIWLAVATCITGLPVMRFGHPTPGHYLAVLILVLRPVGIYAGRLFGKKGNYAQIIIMSTTLFISLIPAIVETLTRLPMEHPLASGPNDPIIQIGKIILGVIFLSGLTYQLLKAKPK